jgi:hypothetical protein
VDIIFEKELLAAGKNSALELDNPTDGTVITNG